MLKDFVGLLIIVAGATATDTCDDSIDRVCTSDNEPKPLPKTAEELQEFCNFALGFFRCGVEYTEKCEDNDRLKTRSYLKIFEEVCNEDTLLYAGRLPPKDIQLQFIDDGHHRNILTVGTSFRDWQAVLKLWFLNQKIGMCFDTFDHVSITAIDNLHCFNELRMKGPDEECARLNISPSVETFHKYAKALAEEEHPVFSGDESEVNNTLQCLPMLQELACYGTKLEDKCGTIAMDTYVEIVQKFGPVAECGESYDYLPIVIRVYKLEKEEVDDIAEIFKKKK